MMERFAKIVRNLYPLTIFAKRSIIDFGQVLNALLNEPVKINPAAQISTVAITEIQTIL